MKTIKNMLLIILSIWAVTSYAQVVCGITQPYFYSANNPNGVPVFHDTSTYSAGWQPISYFWDFGDSTTSTLASPSHVFAGSGNYVVCMTVTAQLQGTSVTCSQTYCKNYSNCANMVSSAYTFTQQGGGSVNFVGTGSSNYPPLFFSWDFGDGTTGLGSTVPHTYSANGTYTACLYVADSNGCSSTTCHTINVTSATNACANVQASFSATVGNGSVTVNSTSTGVLTGSYYQWYINGTTTSMSNNSSYTWGNLSAGTYNICLFVWSSSQQWCDSSCQTVIVTSSNPCSGLTSAWTVLQHQGNAYSFAGANNSSNVIHIWTIDGVPVGTSQNLTYTFPSDSNSVVYQICHKVQIPGTVCIDSTCQNLVVAGTATGCGSFTAYISQSTNPNGVVTLTAQHNSSANVSYAWNTGATTASITPNTGGYFCVTVSDANGCSAVACDSANTTSPCNLNVAIAAQGSGFPYVLYVTVSGGASPYSYYWSNGGSNSNYLTVTTPGTYCLSVIDNNQCIGTACYTVAANTTDTICGVIFNDINGNGVQDASEYGLSGYLYIGNYSVYTDSFGYYTAPVPAGTYNIYYCSPSGYTTTLPVTSATPGTNNCAHYGPVTISGGGMHCGFDFGIQNSSVNVCGTVFFDANHNNVQDSTDNGISGVHVYVTGSNGTVYHVYTNQLGQYCLNLPAGNYTVTISSNTFQTCVSTPQTLTVAATTVGQSYSNNNFAIYCQPGACNLSITVTPHTTVTAGFPAWYDVQVCNVGASVSSGTVNFFYDKNALVFDYASPTQTSHNATTGTVSWALNNLLPGDCEYYWVNFDALTSVQLNQFVFTLVNVTPGAGCNDVNMANNVDTVHQAVTSSWDPNNKLAYVTNYETNPSYQWVSSLQANQRIEYVVNFQNTGNSPAVNVVVLDELSGDLDENSFEFIGSSHNCMVSRNGKQLSFKFSDIMLADSTSNEPNSHGFVKFAVNSLSGLQAGHIISDDAAIYFDYNSPVLTNDAAVTLIDVNGVEEITATTVVVAPNPMSSFTQIQLRGNSNPFTFRVTDMTGRVVAEHKSEGGVLQFERNGLATGMYTYQILQNNKPAANGKLVIE